MQYLGQLHDQNKVGNSQLTESEAGCFNYSFLNLEVKLGLADSIKSLNDFFTNNHVYTYDSTDKANDDLYWNSITKKIPQLVVQQINGAGFPTSDLAIVKFYYQSVQSPWLDQAHTQKNMVTHFCAVNSAADKSIIDSWDGLVKTPTEYEHVYGTPVASATYVYHTTATIPVSLPPSAPVSAPKAAAPALQPPAPATPTQLVLPKTDHYYLWHVYKEGGPWTLPYAIGALDPFHYGPETFDVLGNPAPHIFIIQTQSFGRVAIYAGPDTVAQFPQGGHGEGEDTSTFVPDPPATPATSISPTVTSETTTPAVTYALVQDGPYDLRTKPGAQRVNFVSGFLDKTFEGGERFIAVGKATMPNNDTYYMDQHSFGQADTTQQTPMTVGIKTTELVWPAKSEDPAASTTSDTQHATPSENEGAVKVNIVPSVAAPWKNSFKLLDQLEQKYLNRDLDVYDFSTGTDMHSFPKGTPVIIGGTFRYNGIDYYRSQNSIEKHHTWYGFPFDSLADDIDHEETEISKAKQAAIKAAATGSSWIDNLKINKGTN